MAYPEEEKQFYNYLRKKYFGSNKFRTEIIKTYEKDNGKLDKKSIN